MPTVEIDSDQRRFIVRAEGGIGTLRYNIVGSRIILEHTEVDPALRGGGVAASLARAGLEYARAHGLTVIPVCPYVIGFLARHPEYGALIDQPRQPEEPGG